MRQNERRSDINKNSLILSDTKFVAYCKKSLISKPLWKDKSGRTQTCWYCMLGDYGILEFTRFPNIFSLKDIFIRYTVWRGEKRLDPSIYKGEVHLDPYTEEPIYAVFSDFNNAVLYCRAVILNERKDTE